MKQCVALAKEFTSPDVCNSLPLAGLVARCDSSSTICVHGVRLLAQCWWDVGLQLEDGSHVDHG